jgi:hypothetical protein
MESEREVSTKQKRKKKTVIISIICVFIAVFLGLGILFYKSHKNKNQEPQQAEALVDTKQNSKPKKSKNKEAISAEKELEIALEELIEGKEETSIDSTESETEDSNITEEPKELTEVHISYTKSLFGKIGSLPDNLSTGKVYYQGNNGKLESFIKREGDKIFEQLVSSDYKEDKVDELEIGIIEEADKAVKHAVISKNKVSVFEIIPAKNGKKTEERVTEYTITPQMRFIKGKTYVRVM